MFRSRIEIPLKITVDHACTVHKILKLQRKKVKLGGYRRAVGKTVKQCGAGEIVRVP